MTFLVVNSAICGAIPGVMLGLSFNRGLTEPIAYGAFAASGAALAANMGGWPRDGYDPM